MLPLLANCLVATRIRSWASKDHQSVQLFLLANGQQRPKPGVPNLVEMTPLLEIKKGSLNDYASQASSLQLLRLMTQVTNRSLRAVRFVQQKDTCEASPPANQAWSGAVEIAPSHSLTKAISSSTAAHAAVTAHVLGNTHPQNSPFGGKGCHLALTESYIVICHAQHLGGYQNLSSYLVPRQAFFIR